MLPMAILKLVAQRRILDGLAARPLLALSHRCEPAHLRVHRRVHRRVTSIAPEAILVRVAEVEEGGVIGALTGVFILLRLALRDAGPTVCLLRDAGIGTHLASLLQASFFVGVVFRALSSPFTLG
jgi:hypothetical protein